MSTLSFLSKQQHVFAEICSAPVVNIEYVNIEKILPVCGNK